LHVFWKKRLTSAWLTYVIKVNIDDGFLNLMTQDGTSKDDVKVPESDLGGQISSGFEEGKDLIVTIIAAMGEEQVSFAYL
jgi:hypothetical protein